jgi:threonine/homoserine/homoserine lactone efflux protein
MENLPNISLFITTAAVLVFTPGPNTLYIIARSIQQGRLAGAVSSLGVQVGTFIHMIIAALGLSALIVSSETVFTIVKYAGAAYLIYLGLKTLRAKEHSGPSEAVEHKSYRQTFRQGIIVNLLNPKTALFFFAFLPQFINPRQQPVALQILMLGLILIALGTTSDMLYALTAGSFGAWLRQSAKMLVVQRYFAAVTYIALGILAALSGGNG